MFSIFKLIISELIKLILTVLGAIMESVLYKDEGKEKIEIAKVEDVSKVNDGYHTFEELYIFRTIYNALIFNKWASEGLYEVHKSMKHHDGEACFGKDDMFIVSAKLPSGCISNHYNIKYWEVFKIPSYETSIHEYDGHTPEDVVYRILKMIADDEV